MASSARSRARSTAPASSAASRARKSAARPGSASGWTWCLRASARIANRRSSTRSSSPGSSVAGRRGPPRTARPASPSSASAAAEAVERRVERALGVRRGAFEPAQRVDHPALGAFGPQRLGGARDVGPDALGGLQRAAARVEPRLLVRLGREPVEFGGGVAEIVGVARSRLPAPLRPRRGRCAAAAAGGPGGADGGEIGRRRRRRRRAARDGRAGRAGRGRPAGRAVRRGCRTARAASRPRRGGR